MKKLYIFDLDGTLCDTLESLTHCVNYTLHQMGLGEITKEQCITFIGNGGRNLIKRSIDAAGGDAEALIDEAYGIYNEYFDDHCTYKVVPYPGVVDLLKAIKAGGGKLAVLSNKQDPMTKTVIKTVFEGIEFDEVRGQKDSVPKKPDPAAVYSIMEQFGVSAEECVYIGDSEVDVKTGLNAGVETIAVSWGFRSVEALKEAGAERIIDRAEEILN